MVILNQLRDFEELFRVIKESLPDEEKIYLVGGAVRDVLVGRELHDLDFVMSGHVRQVAKKVANAWGGAFYMLDEERQTARVICENLGRRLTLDFALLRTDNLSGDLAARDFSVNAMAMDLFNMDRLIDPLQGALDLKEKRLRMCSPSSLLDDPIRVLRGIRLSLAFNLQIPAETLCALREAAPKVPSKSPERQRDELFRMFGGKKVSTSIRLMDTLGILPHVLPELVALKGIVQSSPHTLDVWEHTIATIQELERLLEILAAKYDEDASASLFMGLGVLKLGQYRTQLEGYFSEVITADRSRRSLSMFSALYHDIAKPAVRSVEANGRTRFFNHEKLGVETAGKRAKALMLSQIETQFVETLVNNHMRIHSLVGHGNELTPRLIHRYFRKTGEAGVAVCLLTLADLLATYRQTLSKERWLEEVEVSRELLHAWYEKPLEVINPPRLISGFDIQEKFLIKPGPLIGRILEKLMEAQAAGEVRTSEEAFRFVETLVMN